MSYKKGIRRGETWRCLHLGVGVEAFLVKALVNNTDDKIKGLIIHPSKVIFGRT